jgi:haloalkane dehalogenase
MAHETLFGWPWEPNYADVGEGRIHYIDVGKGPTVVLLHGCPAWSYMWRNVIPTLSKSARVLAVDMLGMGRSDKPEVGYTYFDHLRYLTSFFKAKVPPGSVFIGHDWGSALGLSMMRRGVFEPSAFGASELFTVLPPEAYGKPDPAHNRWRTLTGNLVVSFCDPEMGPLLVGELDVFNRAVLPLLMERKLSDGERNAYCSVYPTPGSRRALWTWPTQVPLWDPTRHPQGIRGPKEVLDEFTESGKWLIASEQPKLFFTLPNGMTKSTTGDWLASNLQKATVTHLGPGRHYGPEDYPDDVARSITAWLGKTGVIASEKLEK